MSLQIQTLEPTFNTLNFVKELAITYTPKLAGAIVVYLIGSVLIGWVSKLIQKTMNVKKVDVSLQSFLSSFVSSTSGVMITFYCPQALIFSQSRSSGLAVVWMSFSLLIK